MQGLPAPMHPRGFMACKLKMNWRSPILDKKSLI
jgi:hypothetical protein